MGDWLVNCAGPTLDFRDVRNPLVRSLLKRGWRVRIRLASVSG